MSEQRWTRDGRTAVLEVQDEGGFIYAPPGCIVVVADLLADLLTDAGWTRATPENPAAPKWAELFGADPDYCEGMDVDEWLDRNRGEA